MPDFTLKVEIGGKAVSFTAVRVQYQINQVPFAVFSLSLSREETNLQKEIQDTCVTGASVNITLNEKPLFNGMLTRWVSEYIDKKLLMTFEASHNMQKLKINQRSAVFIEKTDNQILSQIFQEQNIKLLAAEGMDIQHKQMVQFNSSDWRFIRARTRASGIWIVPTPSGVSLVKPKVPRPDVVVSADSSELWHLISETDVSALPEDIELTSWNIAEQKAATAKAAPSNTGEDIYSITGLKSLKGVAWHFGLSSALEAKERELVASSSWLNSRLNSLRATLKITGGLAPEVGKGIRITGFHSGIDGTALITQVRHEFSKNAGAEADWCTVISVGQDPNGVSSGEIIPEASGLHIGIVDKNDGPDENHALNIMIPALQIKTAVRARLSVPLAGKESGFNFYPQQGDEVVVAFFDNDPRFPVILGAMHNPVNKAPVQELNNGIGMVLKTGELTQRLLLHPENGLLLEEKKGGKRSQIVLKDGIVSVESTNNVSMTADQKILISGSSGVEIKGSKVELKK